jgi:hypothetical protein
VAAYLANNKEISRNVTDARARQRENNHRAKNGQGKAASARYSHYAHKPTIGQPSWRWRWLTSCSSPDEIRRGGPAGKIFTLYYDRVMMKCVGPANAPESRMAQK